jgi:hypothetical protein
MPSTPTSNITPLSGYPDEDEVDWGSDDDNNKDKTDSICEEATVNSPETKEEQRQDSVKRVITGQQLNVSNGQAELPELRLVSIHNRNMKALSRHCTCCNEANIILIQDLIQEDTSKPSKRLESVPRTSGYAYNPSTDYCWKVNTPGGCSFQSCFYDHGHKGVECFKARKWKDCPNNHCVFLHPDDHTRGYRYTKFEKSYYK